jgi:HK97 family phage portal protein
LAPVYASVRLLADSVASLPLHVYRKNPDGTRVRVMGPNLFDDPSPGGGTVYDWLYSCMTSLALQGNAYGYKTGFDGYGFPTGIEWLPADRVEVRDERVLPTASARYFLDGREIEKDRLLHVRAFTQPGMAKGLSPLSLFTTLIGSGLETWRYGNDWFAAGGFPPGTFKNTARTVDPVQADQVRARLVSSMRRRQPLVFGADWDYNPIMVPPNEAQFIQSLKLNATQIAAIYGIPPERVGGERGNSLTYSTQEQEEISFLNTTLRPWLVRLEAAFFGLLPERRYVRFNVDSMLRTDLKTRHEVYWIDRLIGLHNLDEIRELEDLPPLPDGQGQQWIDFTVPGPGPDENPSATEPTPAKVNPLRSVRTTGRTQ